MRSELLETGMTDQTANRGGAEFFFETVGRRLTAVDGTEPTAGAQAPQRTSECLRILPRLGHRRAKRGPPSRQRCGVTSPRVKLRLRVSVSPR